MKNLFFMIKLNSPQKKIIATAKYGFTLIEVLIAIVLIGVAGSIFVGTSHNSLIGNQRSKTYGAVALATQEALENVVLLPLDSLKGLSNTILQHSQGSGVTIKASSRGVTSADMKNINQQDTTTLRYVTLMADFKNQAGNLVTKTYGFVVYRPR